MMPAKPTVCHHVVHFERTMEHGEGTRRGVERSVNTLVARYEAVMDLFVGGGVPILYCIVMVLRTCACRLDNVFRSVNT